MTEPLPPAELTDVLVDHARELERLRALHDETTARLDALQLDVAEIVQAAESSSSESAQGCIYEDWHTWVTHWLEPRISRSQHHKWCPKLDEHPEAEMRLGASWHAWEALWPKPAERGGWLRDHLDPQLAVLFASDGPLRLCSAHEHQHATPPALDQSDVALLSVPRPTP